MTLILSGTDGLSDVDGTAATPAIRGTDTNTGIFFPAADTIAFSEGGAEVARFDSSGNFGIGTSSPAAKLDVRGIVRVNEDNAGTKVIQLRSDWAGVDPAIQVVTNNSLLFVTNGSERARIDGNGNVMTGATSATFAGYTFKFSVTEGSAYTPMGINSNAAGTGATNVMIFARNGTQAGSITITGTTATYGSGSDYRLKNDVVPLNNALAKISLLRPVSWKWKIDDSYGEGFIAHELAEVCPQAVIGQKDEVNADGDPVYQSVDTSFLVATLTAAIQEQQAIIQSLTARIEALEGK